MPDVTHIVFGTADLADAAAPGALLDRFVERGGRRIDLANVYAAGESSRLVGRWLRGRDQEAKPTLYVKGCHPPYCSPELVAKEVDEARALLGVDRLDSFILHRDDPTVDADAWVEALREQIERGAVDTVGVSNWTTPRFHELRAAFGDDANLLAVFSNHLSLAVMVTPTWPGCLAMTREEALELAGTGVDVIAWAALAAGFFGGRDPASWDAEANRARRARVNSLAAEHGVAPATVATAYLLNQLQPILAAVGTRAVEHLDQVLAAADLELQPADLRWLENGVCD